MSLLKIFLLFSIIHNATSQNRLLNLTSFNNQLLDVFTGLSAMEVEIASILNNLSSLVMATNGNFRSQNGSDSIKSLVDQMDLLLLEVNLQGTISSHGQYQNVTSCGDLRSKIRELAVNVDNYVELAQQAIRNQSELYERGLWVTYSYFLAIGTSENCKNFL